MDLYLNNANHPVEISVWFKSIDGPPDKMRTSEYLNDLGAAVGHRAQHVEIKMPDGFVYSANISEGVVEKSDKDHCVVTNESYWTGYRLRISRTEAGAVQKFAEDSVGQPYRTWDIVQGYFRCCLGEKASSGNRSGVVHHTCTSICFQSLAQSEVFENILRACDEDYRQRKAGDMSVYTCNPDDLLAKLDKMVDWCSHVEEYSGVVTRIVFAPDRNRVADLDYYNKLEENANQREYKYESFSSSSGSDCE
jgi:hypothetical protein